MRRACRVTIDLATDAKQRQIAALLEAYRAAVNFYIRSLWDKPGRLDRETLARLRRTRLSERYKSQALKQALEVVKGTRRGAKAQGIHATCPSFTGAATLDAKFVTIEDGQGSFDLVIKLSTLHKGNRILIPARRTAVLNKWLNQPGARLIQGCSLSENNLTLWVEVPELEPKHQGCVLGVDCGVNKLLADSDGNHYGPEFRAIRDKIRRRKPGSKNRRDAHRERDNFIGRTVNELNLDNVAVLGVEALHDMKRGKKKGRGKPFRKAIAPWTYRQVLNRIENRTTANRVRLIRVDPANTSRQCPACDTVRKDNRSGEKFLCVTCGHKGDADTIGAQNILARTLATLGSIESPKPINLVR